MGLSKQHERVPDAEERPVLHGPILAAPQPRPIQERAVRGMEVAENEALAFPTNFGVPLARERVMLHAQVRRGVAPQQPWPRSIQERGRADPEAVHDDEPGQLPLAWRSRATAIADLRA